MRTICLAAIIASTCCNLISEEVDESAVAAALARIGTWDGTTPSAELAQPYADPTQAAIKFGERSFWLQPWRSYLDTWPARAFLSMPGVSSNGLKPEHADAVCQLLAEHGFRTMRVEIGWGSLEYDDETQLKKDGALRILAACHRHGIRPVILLNAHHGWPCPTRTFDLHLAEAAAEGATRIRLETKGRDRIHLGYSGLRGVDQRNACPLITAIDDDGWATLSKPLPKALEAGTLRATTLKYQPFAGSVFADGTPNPAANETVAGWRRYVATICTLAQQAMGTTDTDDAGFDLEVWNEYTFGSDFLRDDRYHNPKRAFAQAISYHRHGRSKDGHELILPLTVDYANDPANGCEGVRVISGFSNQRPWDHGAKMWPGQHGISKHYYTNLKPNSSFSGKEGLVRPGSDPKENSGPLDALGQRDGTRDKKDWHTVIPGTAFVPTHRLSMPEARHFGYQTEFHGRDLIPFPKGWGEHYRYGQNGYGQWARVWQTEFNCYRRPWYLSVEEAAGIEWPDQRAIDLLEHVAAKAILRGFLFHHHKGMETITWFSIGDRGGHDIRSFSLFPPAFFDALDASSGELTPAVRATAGRQLAVVGRLVEVMARGDAMAEARALTVERLVEHQPRLVYAGDGTPAHPDVYHRHDFACLPYQLDARRFAVGYYVVTRNLVHEWEPQRELLDPARYDMPEQRFDLTLGNVRGTGATVEAVDPLTGDAVPVEVLAAEATSLIVALPTTDCPRLLLVTEASDGPLVQSPAVITTDDGSAELRFRTGPGTVTISTGIFPERSGAIERRFELDAEETFRERIDLGENHALRVTVERDGLVATWPRWDHDVAGRRFTGAAVDPVEEGSSRFPELPGPRPTLAIHRPGDSWRSTPQGYRAGSVPTDRPTTIRLEREPGDDPSLVLPVTSDLDTVTIEAGTFVDHPAWLVHIELDPVAHPGRQDLRHDLRIIPTTTGLIVAAATGLDRPTQAWHALEHAITPAPE